MSANNKPLSRDRKALVIGLLAEGSSVNSVVRLLKIGRSQLLQLLLDAGDTAKEFHNLVARELKCVFVAADECWSYIGQHEGRMKPGYDRVGKPYRGDVWLLSSQCARTKFIIAQHVRRLRNDRAAERIIAETMMRIPGSWQLCTDKWNMFLYKMRELKREGFAAAYEKKVFGSATRWDDQSKTVVNTLLGCQRGTVVGNPDLSKATTSYLERQHLAFRTTMRRYNRRTLCYSKSFKHHTAACRVNTFFHNYCRKSEAEGIKGRTPAMALGLTGRPITLEEFVVLIEQHLARKDAAKWEKAFALKAKYQHVTQL